MPIVVHITDHPSKGYTPPRDPPTSPQALLNGLGREYACEEGGVIQDSVPEADIEYFATHRNGFVRTVLDAYAGHHHIVLRPDDVWIAILTQLNYYFQAHPDVARQVFASPEESSSTKRALPVNFIGAADSVNIAVIANQMTRDLQTQIKDPDFREFILPNFSTTSIEDKIICASLMVASLDTLYEPSVSLMCGIPTIALLGGEGDWQTMLDRVKGIADGNYGNEARHWGSTLVVILSKIVTAFKEVIPGVEWWGGIDQKFWRGIVEFQKGAGEDGAGLIGGWITAFARWGPTTPTPTSTSAQPHGRPSTSTPNRPDPLPESALYDPYAIPDSFPQEASSKYAYFAYEGLKFPTISPKKIPSAIGVLSFPLMDNGQEKPARLIAGHLGKTWFGVNDDTVQPCPCWILYYPGVNATTPGPASGSESATDRMRRAVTVMMKTKKKQPRSPAPSAAASSQVPMASSTPTSTPPPKDAPEKIDRAENNSKWQRLINHGRKYSEKFKGPGPDSPEKS